MKTYWIAAGAGTLVTVLGGVVYFTSRGNNGLVILLGGLVFAVMALVMALIQWGMDKSK